MLLAGDIGGTKTVLGLFSPAPERPAAVDVGEFVTLDYDGLEPIVHAFLEAFRAKEPMAALVATVPVAVILNPDAGLIGAAVHAMHTALAP